MISKATKRFWDCFDALPKEIRNLATKNYFLWRENPSHPSLAFKRLSGAGERFSVRVGAHYRAIGRKVEGGVEWVWIGSHEDYNRLV